MEGNRTVQKPAPLCASSAPLSPRCLQACCTLASLCSRLARLCLLFFLFFFIFFLILHHWSWRMLALVLSPRRIVTYGNAEDGDPGHYQVRGANSLMRTDDCVIVPVSHGHLFPFLDPIYQALGSFHDWWQWCYCCCPPAMCRR